jgi:hypothetical protein
MGTEGFLQGIKRPGLEEDQSYLVVEPYVINNGDRDEEA